MAALIALDHPTSRHSIETSTMGMELRWAGKIEHDGLVPPMSVCLLQECSLKSPNQLWPLIAGEEVGLAVEALQPRR